MCWKDLRCNWSLKVFLFHRSDGSQSAKWSRGTTDRSESDTSDGRRKRESALEDRIEMSPPSLAAALWSYNSGPRWVRCQLFQTHPQQHCLNFEWILSTFLFLHMTSPCLSFIQLLSVYGYMENLLCLCHTLFRKVKQAQRRGEGVSVLFTTQSSRPSPHAPYLTIVHVYKYPSGDNYGRI